MDNEEEKVEPEVLDFTTPDYTFSPNSTHNWKQRGYYIHCTGCDLEHGIFIGSEQILTGLEDDGRPILKKRELV